MSVTLLGTQKQVDPWGFLASQSSHLAPSRFSERLHLKNKMERVEDTQRQPLASTRVQACMHAHLCAHAPTYTFTHHIYTDKVKIL